METALSVFQISGHCSSEFFVHIMRIFGEKFSMHEDRRNRMVSPATIGGIASSVYAVTGMLLQRRRERPRVLLQLTVVVSLETLASFFVPGRGETTPRKFSDRFSASPSRVSS